MLDIVCIICSESFTEAHEVYITYCGHLFDHRCLKEWMRRSQSCPQCRKYCTDAQIHKVFFTLSENLPSTSSASRNVILENDLQNAEDEDVYDLLLKADEVIRVLAETDYEEIETIFALKEKVQEKEGTIMSYVEEVNRLKDEIIALQVKVTSIECERERCEFKGNDLNNIMGTLKCDLQTESEIRRDSELRLVQLDKIFLSPQDEENEAATSANRNIAERPKQGESTVPTATQVPQTMTGVQVAYRGGVKRPILVDALTMTTPAAPAPKNHTSEGLTTRKTEELLSLLPSTSLAGVQPANPNIDRIYHWVTAFPVDPSVQPMESDGSQVSSDVNSRASESKQLLRLAKDRARVANWKFVWRKYGQILARREEFSKVIRIKNVNDLKKIE